MRNFILLILAAVTIISCNSISGEGDITKDERNVGEFDAIKNSGSIDVKIIMGDKYEVVVEDYENLLNHIVTEVNNGALNIHFEDGLSVMNTEATVYITVTTLNKVYCTGSSDTEISGVLKSDSELELSVTGSGSIKGSVDAPSVDISITGSGEMDIEGRTKNMKCRITGSGDFNGSELKSENCTISVSGSGDANVFASVSLVAKVSGSGNITYGGNPPDTKINKNGSGTISSQN